MKLIVLALILSLTVICHVKAFSLRDLVERSEELEDLFNSEQSSESDEDDGIAKRENKDYLNAKKQPERLRLCIKCVGVEREKGKNVKQATKHCNQVCKRDLIFDTRSIDWQLLDF